MRRRNSILNELLLIIYFFLFLVSFVGQFRSYFYLIIQITTLCGSLIQHHTVVPFSFIFVAICALFVCSPYLSTQETSYIFRETENKAK